MNRVCTKCRTPLQFIANKTMAKCPHCNTMYFADDAHAEISIHESFVRTELTEGEGMLNDKRWDGATTCFARLVKAYPLEIDAWLGLARALTREQTHFCLSGSEYALLTQCLWKVQTLQGALLDDSWRAYREKYELYRDKQRMELQEQCEKLAHWVDHKQDGDSKMAARLILITTAFLVFILGCVMCVIDTRLWFLIPITGGIAFVLMMVVMRFNAKADITADERKAVRKRCAELQKQAEYWNVKIFFRQDIRNIINDNK